MSNPTNGVIHRRETATEIVPFEPQIGQSLIRRGLDRLALIEERRSMPATSRLSRDVATILLTRFTAALGTTLLTYSYPFDGPRPRTFSAEQRQLARACLFVCANAEEAPTATARGRLGAVTDVVGDDRRFHWLDALPLRLALNVAGEGNGGIRTLIRTLNQSDLAIRQSLLEYAWYAREQLDPEAFAPVLLAGVAGPAAGWAVPLALLRAMLDDETQFLSALAEFQPKTGKRRYHARIATVHDLDSRVCRYLRNPRDLLRAEAATRQQVFAQLADLTS